MIGKRWAALITTTGLLASLAAAPGAVSASARGRKNMSLLLGAGAVHSLLKGKTTQGVVLGVGSAYAYKRYKDKKSGTRARKAAQWGYRRGHRAARRARRR